ncbi:MAG: hypothetical protein ACK4IT_04955 [Thioalkalivibrionaceae bacterium]
MFDRPLSDGQAWATKKAQYADRTRRDASLRADSEGALEIAASRAQREASEPITAQRSNSPAHSLGRWLAGYAEARNILRSGLDGTWSRASLAAVSSTLWRADGSPPARKVFWALMFFLALAWSPLSVLAPSANAAQADDDRTDVLASNLPRFSGLPERDQGGFFTVGWVADGAVEVEWTPPPAAAHEPIEGLSDRVAGDAGYRSVSAAENRDAAFVLLYRGGDEATTLSGLVNGEYRFRLRAQGSDVWSDEAVVTVEHHSLARAFGFFVVGASVFVVLIVSIAVGIRRSSDPNAT